MQYLVRLIAPKGALCLDPFNGSGTTGIACKLEGVNYIGIEREKEYCDISEARIKAWQPELDEAAEHINESLEVANEQPETTKQLGLF
jgi:site-specific DNA-methyltransferase (adenine-specific)